MVLGSVVRTTGSGLACPDWPLCEGRIIPRFQFNVLIEWWHRAIALFVSLCLFATVVWIWAQRETRRRLGGLAALAVGLLFLQILLGALTVLKLLSPSVVSSHLAVALLLFSTLVLIERGARAAARPAEGRGSTPTLALSLLAVTLFTFVQAVLGGAVGSSHAGTVCPDWPACQGELFPPLTGLIGLQMAHRYTAYLLIAVMIVMVAATRRTRDHGIRVGVQVALAVVLVQATVGVFNVLLKTPVWLSAIHLGMATAMLGLLVATSHRALMGMKEPSSLQAAGAIG
jgi:cytochrome c oxidase assembly protein subunit 15